MENMAELEFLLVLEINKITIMDVLDGYSAQKQGVRIGDVITGIGDKVVEPEIIDEISSLVKENQELLYSLKL